MKFLSLFVLGVSALSFGQQTDSKDNFGSLTPKNYVSPFKARTAHKAGDPLTVIISESNISQYQTNTQNNKKEEVKNGPNSVPLADWLKVGFLSALTSASNSSTDQQLQTSGASTQRGTMTAKVAVLVKQVLPNGVLVLEGTRAVKFGRETQTVTLTGLCRVDDVRTDNTVLSENLANAEIKSAGVGAIYQKQRQGFLAKILGWLF